MSPVEQEIRVQGITIGARPRTDWTIDEATALFELPLFDLLYAAQWVHRQHFDPHAVQVSTLLSIKTGRCPEDCSYCPQSIRFNTDVDAHDLMPLDEVRRAAKQAKAAGATRFCMGASYRGPKDAQLEPILAMIREVKAMGLETCATLGLLRDGQAEQLADAGLDYYNHNLDTSEAYYPSVITTRTFADRIDTLSRVRAAGLKVCCGGILGLGESRADRVGLLHALATLEQHPESVPINRLVKVAGTPLEDAAELDSFEFVRTVAAARVLMPTSYVRLSAGRTEFSDELQALCFLAGANSLFYGEKLLTTDNPSSGRDDALFARLGLTREEAAASPTREVLGRERAAREPIPEAAESMRGLVEPTCEAMESTREAAESTRRAPAREAAAT